MDGDGRLHCPEDQRSLDFGVSLADAAGSSDPVNERALP